MAALRAWHSMVVIADIFAFCCSLRLSHRAAADFGFRRLQTEEGAAEHFRYFASGDRKTLQSKEPGKSLSQIYL